MSEGKANLPFIPAALDDAKLKPVPFRVFGAICRRAGGDGECWESLPKMSKRIGLHVETVRDAIKVLLSRNMIRETPRKGDTTLYKPLPPEQWTPLEQTIPLGGKQRGGIILGGDSEETIGDPLEQTIPHPLEQTGSKGTPLKLPPEVTPEGSPNTCAGLTFPLHLNSPAFHKAWREWMEYLPTVKRGKKSSFTKTFQYQLNNKLTGLTEAEAIQWIEEAIGNHWQGLHQPNRQNNFRTKPATPQQKKDHSKW